MSAIVWEILRFGGFGMPTKAVSASGSVLLAGAITTVILGVLGHPVTPEMQGAITTIVSAVLAGLGAYLPAMEGQKQ